MRLAILAISATVLALSLRHIADAAENHAAANGAADSRSAGVAHEPASRERALILAAAEALGGLERVRHVRNITLIGYGMYAYQFGGGNVTASPLAVQRYLAANDLRRVYDLEHGRFQQTERRNMLFTFARAAPTLWEPFNLVLDGDIAYDVATDGSATRSRRWVANAWYVDGVHMRRMWMLNNPVAVVRAALDPATTLGPVRSEPDARNRGKVDVVDLTLKEGDRLTLAVSQANHLPAWVRWNNPHNTFGELTFTTYLEGYAPYDGLLLPMSYNTKTDWRNMSELQISVDGYAIDDAIANLEAPAAVRSTPEPELKLSPVTATPIAKGVWYLSGGPLSNKGVPAAQGTTVFEFADHLVLFELNSKPMAKAIIDFAKTLVPGKVPTAVITSHAHTDHIDGIRVAVAEGLSVISRRENELIIRDMIAHPAPDYPDELSKHPRPLKFVPVDEHLRLEDPTMIVDVYWARANSHMADGLFAYAPAAKVMAEADIATAARDYQPWADNYMDDIEHYHLDVQTLLPVHFPPMKQQDVIEFIKGGVARFRERCAAEVAKGEAYQGCPVLTRRYLAEGTQVATPAAPAPPGTPSMGNAPDLFANNCAGCHGTDLAGGRGPSLFAESLLSNITDAALLHTIREGIVDAGMPTFKGQLSDADIGRLIAYIRVRAGQLKGRPSFLPDPNGQIIKSKKLTFKIDVVVANLNTPWGEVFLPDGRMLVTERPGDIRIIDHGKLLPDPVKNTPQAWARQDGGYFDIALHPDYKRNGWIYLSFSEVAPGLATPPPDDPAVPRSSLPPAPLNMTRLVRGRLNAHNEWVDQQDIFRAPADLYTSSVIHYGTRFLFDGQGHLFWSMGDRGDKSNAQNLGSPLGKIHRVNDDGSVPADNPFVNTPGAIPTIWSYGHRNPEGLSFDRRTGLLWESEHGPVGGDEINIIEKGHNYGWGVISMGLEPGISEQHHAGMEDPIAYFTPAIGPSGMSFYTGARYPGWKNSLFLSALVGQRLIRFEIKDRTITSQEVVYQGFGRTRDVITGPDGYLYILLQNSQTLANAPGMVIRLLPMK